MKYLKLIQKYRLTTEDIAGNCALADYYTLRYELAKLEGEGLIERSKESGWRWSLTAKGKEVLEGR